MKPKEKEKIHWDEDNPKKLDLEYYGSVKRVVRCTLIGVCWTVVFSIVDFFADNHLISKGFVIFNMTVNVLLGGWAAFSLTRRMPNAVYLSRAYLGICLAYCVFYVPQLFEQETAPILEAFFLVGMLTTAGFGLYTTYKSEEFCTLFPPEYRKHSNLERVPVKWALLSYLTILIVKLVVFYLYHRPQSQRMDKMEEIVAYINQNKEQIFFDFGTLTHVEFKGSSVVAEWEIPDSAFLWHQSNRQLGRKLALANAVLLGSWHNEIVDNRFFALFDMIFFGDYDLFVSLWNTTSGKRGEEISYHYTNKEILQVLPATESPQECMRFYIATNLEVSNASLPAVMDNGTTLREMRLENEFVEYWYDIDESAVDFSILKNKDENFSNMKKKLKTDRFSSSCQLSGYGIRYCYVGSKSREEICYSFTRDQIEELCLEKNPL